MGETLRKLGFEVFSRSDLGKSDFEDALKQFTREASGADLALVYYAGHGIEKGGVNYLIPVDASLAADSDIAFETVPLDLVLRSVAGARRLKVIILDACSNNPFRDAMRRSAGTRSIGQGLAPPPDTSEGDMLVSYAAGVGATAEDGADSDSPFATALVRRLTEPGLDIRIVFGEVRDDVRADTHQRQDPALYESLSGQQYFLVQPSSGVAPGEASPEPASVEIAFWQSVQASNDQAQLEAYLSRYPNGAFASLARVKIAALSAKPQPQPWPPRGDVQTPPAKEPAPKASDSPFAGRWIIHAHDSLGTSEFHSTCDLQVSGDNVKVNGVWGPMSFKSGRVQGDKITLVWNGFWVGGAGGTFEGRLVGPKRIEGRWHVNLVFANDWWAEKQ